MLGETDKNTQEFKFTCSRAQKIKTTTRLYTNIIYFYVNSQQTLMFTVARLIDQRINSWL